MITSSEYVPTLVCSGAWADPRPVSFMPKSNQRKKAKIEQKKEEEETERQEENQRRLNSKQRGKSKAEAPPTQHETAAKDKAKAEGKGETEDDEAYPGIPPMVTSSSEYERTRSRCATTSEEEYSEEDDGSLLRKNEKINIIETLLDKTKDKTKRR